MPMLYIQNIHGLLRKPYFIFYSFILHVYNCFNISSCTFIFIIFSKDREVKRHREQIFLRVVYSPNAEKSSCWDRLKPGVQESVHSSYMVGQGHKHACHPLLPFEGAC